MQTMFGKFFTLYVGILLTMAASGLHKEHKVSGNQQTWDFTLLSLNGNSSNYDLFKVDIRAEFIKRGVYGISGTLEFNFDYADVQFIETKSYRSASGGNQYKILPFRVQKMSMREHMATTFKTFIMNYFVNCSDFPQAEGDDIPMYQINTTYTLDKCQFPTDKLPSYLIAGYYKVVILGTGVVNFFIESIAKVEPKL